MTKIAFIKKRFNRKSLAIIEKVNGVIDSHQKQGYTLTLRQIYYQLVAKGIVPNTHKEYKNLGNILKDARLAGLVSWRAMEDRTRNLAKLSSWKTPADIVEACANQFKHDIWKDQPNHVEVWIEKEALVGVAQKICDQLRVPYFACRGYVSISEQFSAGRRYKDIIEAGQTVHLLHFGDHDPSGVDMTRDNKDQLAMFLGEHVDDFNIHRMALNMRQIEAYKPPPNPTKPKDSRTKGYIKRFGTKKCWELDALEPKVISDIIKRKVDSLRDEGIWEKSLRREERAKKRLRKLAKMA